MDGISERRPAFARGEVMRRRATSLAAALLLASCASGTTGDGRASTQVGTDAAADDSKAAHGANADGASGSTASQRPSSTDSGATSGQGDRASADPARSPSDSSSGSEQPQDTSVTRDPRSSRFTAAMLTLKDVPDGWERVEDPGSDQQDRQGRDSDTENGISICNQVDFGEGIEFEQAGDVAGAVFRKALFGPYATSLAATLPSGQMAQLLSELDRAGRSCRTWTQTDRDGNVTTFTIEPIEVGQLGEQTVAFALTVRRGLFSFDLDVALWRVGNIGAGMFHAGTVG
ncbi:MAG: hypothetical protein ACI867_001742, partial [Glaciecola sp.]